MREIKKCYKRLGKNVEHGDMINHSGETGFYLDGLSLHYVKNREEIILSEINPVEIGVRVWSNCLFRRIK